MKKTVCKALLSLLCALTLLLGVVPLAVFRTAAVGADFPWTKEDTLLEKIIQRDGLLDGIWYPWISAGSSGHNLTGNDVMAKYYDTNNGETWATVELDRYGADYVYREIYNLKAMGYPGKVKAIIGDPRQEYSETTSTNDKGEEVVTKTLAVIVNGCKLGGTITTEMVTHENSSGETVTEPKVVTIDESNFFDYIYGGETAWQDEWNYDGCSVLTAKPVF